MQAQALSLLFAPRWVALTGVGLALLAPRAATADASLENAHQSEVLEEVRFVHDIRIAGPFATVHSTQVITNPSRDEQQAVYTFELPVSAAVTGMEVRLADGRTTTAAVIDEQAALVAVPDADSVEAMPDVGLLRLVARDRPGFKGYSPLASASYEARVAPIPPGKVVTLAIDWVAPLRYVDGRLSLRIPHRGDAGNLVCEQVLLTVRPPAGMRGLSAVHGGGKNLGKKPRKRRFTAPLHGDLTIEAKLDFGARKDPVVSFGTAALGPQLGVMGLAVLTPVLSPRGRSLNTVDRYDQALFIVDGSRSMGADGARAAATLVDGLLADLPSRARVEVISFARTARRGFGAFIRNGAKARKRVADALRPRSQENGSNVVAALELARSLLHAPSRRGDGDEAKTLVVLLTDGMLPVSLDRAQVISALGSDVLDRAQLFPIVLAPDGVPMPEVSSGLLADLAHATSAGRALAVRVSAADKRAAELSAELDRPASYTDLRLDAGHALVEDIAMPFSLTMGQGLVRVGVYRGQAPRRVVLHARQRGQEVGFSGTREGSFARVGAALGLVSMVPADFVASDARITGGEYEDRTLARARRRLIRAARSATTVTRHSALIALVNGDRFARDRLAMVQKWGAAAFVRLPPASERSAGVQLRRFQERDPTNDGDDSDLRRTGELDRDIIERLLGTHVMPKSQACYERALRADPKLAGALVVVVEIARGEVQSARIERSTFTGSVVGDCVLEAAYAMQIPRVALGDDPETIGVVNYPLSFKPGKRGQIQVRPDDAPELDRLLLDTDPLGRSPADTR